MLQNIFLTSQSFLIFCQKHKRLSGASIRAYTFDLQNFNFFLSSLEPPIDSYTFVTRNILEGYLQTLQRYQVKTIKRKLAGVRSLFSYLEYEEEITENPFLKFKPRIRGPQKIKECMGIDEIARILKAAYNFNSDGSITGLRDIAILEILFAGGMRVSELCYIKFDDLDKDTMSILIHGKGNKDRKIYLENNEVLTIFKRYMRLREHDNIDCPFIFISRLGSMISTQAVRNIVTKYAKLAKINKNITPHIFRHTFASLLLEQGVDIKYIQDLLGHSSISTTQLYLHTSDDAKRKIIAKMHPREQLLIKSQF